MTTLRSGCSGRLLCIELLLLALLASLVAGVGHAQEDVEDLFEGFGSTSAVEPDAGSRKPGEGTLRGRVVDGETGQPVINATVIAQRVDAAGQAAGAQFVETTDFDGYYEFASVPPGTYKINFVKSGYRASTMTDFEVVADQDNQADFPMPPVPLADSGQVMQLDAFVVTASTVGALMTSLEMRLDSDALLNTFSAEDFSRFAATDVADALKRVAGVNIVEGQFAIIRGLEDRYSSTLWNSAVVPSPDPDRQSPQLDLFPSEIVSNIAISKSFTPDQPSNSSAGSIDIQTIDYPDAFEIKLNAAVGWNDNAIDEFLEYDDNNSFGSETDGTETLAQEYGVSFGGRKDFLDRDFRIKGVFNYEVDYETALGYREPREPRRSVFSVIPAPGQFTTSGDLSLGELNLSGGRFDLTESEKKELYTYFGTVGFDLDENEDHKIDFTAYYTDRTDEIVQLQQDGYLNGFDYGVLREKTLNGDEINSGDFASGATFSAWIADVRESQFEEPNRGPLWYTNFQESTSQKIDRELLITQLNGSHDFEEWIPGLKVRWAGNRAETQQDEDAFGTRVWYEPCGFSPSVPCPEGFTRDPDDIPTRFPSSVDELGPGVYAAGLGLFFNANDIDETQWMARGDIDYERDLWDHVVGKLSLGGWYEHVERNVDSEFLDSPRVNGVGQFAILADTPFDLGKQVFADEGGVDRDEEGNFTGSIDSTNDSTREILAGAFQGKITLFEDLDLLGGLRVEDIRIESRNDPFTGELELDGSPQIFPSKYLQIDRLDNPTRNEVGAPPDSTTTFNDELLNIDAPVDRSTTVCDPLDRPVRRGCVDLATESEINDFVDGEIDEVEYLPSVGFAYRPIEGLSIRGAYSETIARPSFREMGYYVSVETASNNLVVGNPQLDLSEVTSYDARIEYVFPDTGDLIAFSGFYKEIDDPIESILLRDPLNNEDSSRATIRTFFNNSNTADLWGIEVEARKSLDFLGVDFLRYFTIGGNYTYIDAEVERSDVEVERADAFFGVTPEDEGRQINDNLGGRRRLFGQPEWIANADVTFDHPDWGTRFTLAYFAISDVLDAAGASVLGRSGIVESGTVDRYVDDFDQLDFIASQDLVLPRDLGTFTVKFRVKNITDSKRQLVYDNKQTNQTIHEREVKVGRDYKFSLSYRVEF